MAYVWAQRTFFDFLLEHHWIESLACVVRSAPRPLEIEGSEWTGEEDDPIGVANARYLVYRLAQFSDAAREDALELGVPEDFFDSPPGLRLLPHHAQLLADLSSDDSDSWGALKDVDVDSDCEDSD